MTLASRWPIGQIFTWPPQSGLAWFCFLFPLIELDRRVSRIQLSEKGSRCCPRKAGGSFRKPNQSKPVVQELVGVPLGTGSLPLMFGAQPVARQNSNCTSKVILKGVSPTRDGLSRWARMLSRSQLLLDY